MSANPQGDAVSSGRVRWFSEEKGFGLIEASDGGLLVVDHPKIIPEEGHRNGEAGNGFKRLETDCEVEFEVGKDAHGRPLATRVRALKRDADPTPNPASGRETRGESGKGYSP